MSKKNIRNIFRNNIEKSCKNCKKYFLFICKIILHINNMVYQANNAVPPAMTAGGPQTYHNPYYKTQCGCGSGRLQVTSVPAGSREGFAARENMQMNGNGNGNGHMGQAPAGLQAGQVSAPMCTLTATAPPAGCCHPAPLHCDCCNGSGFFRASEAYGS
jgi:hypothetical protein